MSRQRSFIFIGAGVACAAAFILFLLWGHATCLFSSNSFRCYQTRITEVVARKGVAGALGYVYFAILPHNGYGTVHLLMHGLGGQAYAQYGDYRKAMAYIIPYLQPLSDNELLHGFDGYAHGLISDVFANEKDRQSLTSLSNEICEDGQSTPGTPRKGYPCFHVVGHALMYATGSDIDSTLHICAAQTSKEKRDGCAYGAFMEASFLHWPSYHPEEARPDYVNVPMGEFCARYSGNLHATCAIFVGESYLLTHPGDFKGAFATCDVLKTDGDACATRLIVVSIDSLFDSPKKAAAFCEQYGGESHAALCEKESAGATGARFGVMQTTPMRSIANFFHTLQIYYF